MFFYKRIKIQGLGSDMLKAAQNIGSKYAYNMLILCVQIFKTGLNCLFWSSSLFCLFWSSHPEVFFQIDAPAKLPKSLKNICEEVHFVAKL